MTVSSIAALDRLDTRHCTRGGMMPNGDAVRRPAHMKNIARKVAISLALIAVAALHHSALAGDRGLGPFGPEGARMREQLWILPSGDPNMQLRATVFRPSDNAADVPERRPLVVINHGTDEQTRLSVSMPVYYWLSRWFVDRGYVVVIPQRRGHGATGGDLIESVRDGGSLCIWPDCCKRYCSVDKFHD